MNEGLISKRYAKAVYEYAVGRGEDNKLYERMRMLDAIMIGNRRLHETLLNPTLSAEDKESLIYSASGGSPEDSFRQLVRIVLENRRENLIHNVALNYLELYRRENKISVVKLTSAEPIAEVALARIVRMVGERRGGPVELETNVDTALQGGLIFQIDDLRVDASVAGQLEKIRRQLTRRERTIV